MKRIHYRTKNELREYAGKTFVLEVLFDLDMAIDQLCETLGDNIDPLAENLCPYHGVLWPSAEALTQFIVEHKDHLPQKRIIEIGCGLALPSFVATHLGANILASDFHEDVQFFFERNLRHNSMQIPFQLFDWCSPPEEVGQFDLIIGSDVLYESQHPKTIAQAFIRLLAPQGEIWLADPGRGYLQRFIDETTELGFSHELNPVKINSQDIYVFRIFRE